MAKRKKLKNVVIAPDELTPTTIGYLAEKKSNPLFLLFIFAVLFLFLYYIPDINKYIEKKRGNDYTNNVPSEPEEITYDKKKNQLMGHMENLVAIKKELTECAKNSIGHYFSKEKNQYYMDEVDNLYYNYQEEQRRLKEFKQKIEDLKKTA